MQEKRKSKKCIEQFDSCQIASFRLKTKKTKKQNSLLFLFSDPKLWPQNFIHFDDI